MPVDIQDPTTGEIVKQGTAWDCVFYWLMLGTWDGGRQGQFVHGAVNRMHNTLSAAVGRAASNVDTHSMPASTPPESLPSCPTPQEPPHQLSLGPEFDARSQGEFGGDPRPVDRLSADIALETKEDQTTPVYLSPVEDSDHDPWTPDGQPAEKFSRSSNG